MREKGGGKKGHRGRVNTEPASGFEQSSSPPPSGPEQVPPEMMGVVTHLAFAETHPSGRSVGGGEEDSMEKKERKEGGREGGGREGGGREGGWEGGWVGR